MPAQRGGNQGPGKDCDDWEDQRVSGDQAVRGGYKYDPDLFEDKLNATEGMSFGFGAKLPFANNMFKIDYAGEDMGRLSLIHRVALGLEF